MGIPKNNTSFIMNLRIALYVDVHLPSHFCQEINESHISKYTSYKIKTIKMYSFWNSWDECQMGKNSNGMGKRKRKRKSRSSMAQLNSLIRD